MDECTNVAAPADHEAGQPRRSPGISARKQFGAEHVSHQSVRARSMTLVHRREQGLMTKQRVDINPVAYSS